MDRVVEWGKLGIGEGISSFWNGAGLQRAGRNGKIGFLGVGVVVGLCGVTQFVLDEAGHVGGVVAWGWGGVLDCQMVR